MDRFQKILLVLSLTLTGAFGLILYNDWIRYQNNVPEIIATLHLSGVSDLEFSFFSIVLIRACLFLIPAVLLGIVCFVLFYQNNHVPDDPWYVMRFTSRKMHEESKRKF